MTLPYSERKSQLYTADGVQRRFDFPFRSFYDENSGDQGIEVRKQLELDYEVILPSQYEVFNNSDMVGGYVLFNTAPPAGTVIYIAGKTPVTQQLNLANYGRFSAESIETALDVVVAMIQEWISGLSEERRQRILGDANVINVTDQRYNEFKAWVMREFPGIAEDAFNSIFQEFYQQWQDALSQINQNKFPASIIFDASGNNQQEINDSFFAAKKKLEKIVTPFDFGAIGDGVYHKLSEKYATLADARNKYPTAQSLDDSIDLCALEAFFDHCHDNLVNANITLNAYVNRPLYAGMVRKDHVFKTEVYNGDLTLANTQTDVEIPFLMRINAVGAEFTGKLSYLGNSGVDVKDRKQLGGLVLGDNGTDGSAGRIHINSTFCDGFKNFGVILSNDAIFPRIDNMHCGAVGSIGQAYVDSGTTHAATITARTDVDGTYAQHSLLTVTSLPSPKDTDLNILGSMVVFEGDPLPYRIRAVDVANNQIEVYPRLDKNKTYSKLAYIYGVGLGWSGNNSGAGNFGHLQFILCGIGFWGGSLYGANIDYLSSEYCGVGFTLGKENEVVIAYNINNSYFETNLFDYVQQWPNNYSPLLNVNMAHALDINKCAEIFSYRVTPWNDERPQNAFNKSSITLGHRKYEIKDTYSTSVDLSDPCDFINLLNTGGDLLLNYSNKTINDKFQMRAKTLVIAQNYAPWVTPTAITIKVPNGWYLNGVLNGTLKTNPQKFATVLTVVQDASERYNNQSLYVYGDSLYKTSGTTAERPSNAPTGFVYIDTTLNKPIYKTNSSWVDATGTAV